MKKEVYILKRMEEKMPAVFAWWSVHLEYEGGMIFNSYNKSSYSTGEERKRI